MNGKILKEKVKKADIKMKILAERLNIKPQSLQNRFKRKDISVSFLIELAHAANKSVYYFIEGTTYEKEFNISENFFSQDFEPVYDRAPDWLVEAKNHMIELLEREVDDLRNDKAFLKNVIDTAIPKSNPDMQKPLLLTEAELPKKHSGVPN